MAQVAMVSSSLGESTAGALAQTSRLRSRSGLGLGATPVARKVRVGCGNPSSVAIVLGEVVMVDKVVLIFGVKLCSLT